jgi:hypothetical protein
MIYSHDRLLLIADIYNEHTKELGIMFHRIVFGQTWPHDYKNDDNVGRVIKRCAFLNSPFIGSNMARLPHHRRRQMERAGVAPKEREEQIHVVMLRHKSPGTPPQHPGEGIEWKHKWWVTGHYRAQWYPSEEAHKVIWIAPFLKGPDDAPLLEKVYAVIR